MIHLRHRKILACSLIVALAVVSIVTGCQEKAVSPPNEPELGSSTAEDLLIEGTCLDVYTQSGVEGLQVTVDGGAPVFTDQNGQFSVLQAEQTATVVISSGPSSGSYHTMTLEITANVPSALTAIPVEDNMYVPNQADPHYDNVLQLLCNYYLTAWIFYPEVTEILTWQFPIDVHIPSHANVFIPQIMQAVFEQIESNLALYADIPNAYDFVESPVQNGINVEWSPEMLNATMGLAFDTEGIPTLGTMTFGTKNWSPVKGWRNATHEIIHSFRLGHACEITKCPGNCNTFANGLVMHPSPSVTQAAYDENRAIGLLFKLPSGTDLSIYDEWYKFCGSSKPSLSIETTQKPCSLE